MVGLLALFVVSKPAIYNFFYGVGFPPEWSVIALLVVLEVMIGRILLARQAAGLEIVDRRYLRLVEGFLAGLHKNEAGTSQSMAIATDVQIKTVPTIPGRLLNYGTIEYWKGEQQSGLVFNDVPQCERVRDFIEQLAQELSTDSARGGHATAAATGASATIPTAPSDVLEGDSRSATKGVATGSENTACPGLSNSSTSHIHTREPALAAAADLARGERKLVPICTPKVNVLRYLFPRAGANPTSHDYNYDHRDAGMWRFAIGSWRKTNPIPLWVSAGNVRLIDETLLLECHTMIDVGTHGAAELDAHNWRLIRDRLHEGGFDFKAAGLSDQ